MKECLHCGKPVKNKYCNVSCQNRDRKGIKANPKSIEKMMETNKKKWKEFKVNCFKCDKEIIINEYNVSKPKKEKYYCSRSCANSRPHSEETKKKISESCSNSEKVMEANRKLADKNRGKFKIKRIISKCLHCGGDIKHKENEDRKYHLKCWLKCCGGIQEGSSRGKCGWYKGYWCDSSYELAWVIYALDHNIKFERNREGFEYIHDGKKSKYYPDFIIDDGYLEIKNFRSELTDSKISQFPHKIKVYYKDYMKEHILPYVVEKYGKNFIELYE